MRNAINPFSCDNNNKKCNQGCVFILFWLIIPSIVHFQMKWLEYDMKNLPLHQGNGCSKKTTVLFYRLFFDSSLFGKRFNSCQLIFFNVDANLWYGVTYERRKAETISYTMMHTYLAGQSATGKYYFHKQPAK